MIRNIKTLGLAFVAIAAMGALAASAAHASTLHIHANPALLTGQNLAGQQHDLTIPLAGGGNLPAKCPAATFEGTVAEGQANPQATQEATVTATYGPGCKISGQAAHVRMNGCKYTITGAGQPAGTANVDVTGCTIGKHIEIEQTATGCIITVKEQNNVSHIVFQQTGTDAVAAATATNVTATPDAGCPGAGVQVTTATFTGNTTLRAFKDTGTVHVIKHGHTYFEGVEGAEVDITVT